MSDDRNIIISKSCPMCRTKSSILLSKEENLKFSIYESGIGSVQEVFSELTPFEREFLKTGYCIKCQCILFGAKKPKSTRIFKFI